MWNRYLSSSSSSGGMGVVFMSSMTCSVASSDSQEGSVKFGNHEKASVFSGMFWPLRVRRRCSSRCFVSGEKAARSVDIFGHRAAAATELMALIARIFSPCLK